MKKNLKIYCLYILLTVLFLFSFKGEILGASEEECGLHDAIAWYWLEQEPPTRPVLQDEDTIGTTNFIIHYTLTGIDATTLQWAQSTATFAEECWSKVSNDEWKLPTWDNGNGGDNRYDIYIRISGYKGRTIPEDPFPYPYSNGFSSWTEIQPVPVPNQPISDLDRLKVLVAHEFHHACQLRYTLPVNDDVWYMENTSVLMEKMVYPQINYLKYRLADRISPLRSPQFAINKVDGYDYPGGLWPLFLNEFYNDNTATRKTWETAGENPGVRILPNINNTLTENYESDLKEAVKQYAVWRYYTGTRADGSHFSDAINWFTSYVCTTHSTYPVLQTSQPKNVGSPGGTSYLEFSHNSPSFIDLEFDGQDGWEWGAYTIRYYSSGQSIEKDFLLDTNGDGTTIVPLAEYQDHVVLVPIMTDWQNPTSKRDYTYSANRSDLYEVEFMNRIGTANAGDTLLLDGNDIILSGESRYFDNIELHMVETMKERFNQTEIYKHHDWNEIAGNYLLTDDFYTDVFIQYAQFIQLHPATIRNSLISAGGEHAGSFEFHDPWYVHSDGIQYDDFFPYTEILHPTGHYYESEGGVFLDQDPLFDPDIPNYLVRAQQNPTISFHGQDVECYFLGWSGTNVDFEYPNQTETGVVFQASDALAMAKYKGHLATNNPGAVASNSQRKLLFDGTYYHLVYEDGGHIYYTESVNGVDWTAEVKLSNDLFINKGASISLIAQTGTYETICVVWQHGPQINLRKRSLSGEWGEIVLFDLLNSESYDAAPVIDNGNDSHYYIVWRDALNSQGSECDFKIRAYNWDTGEFGTKYQILEMNSYSINPSMISDGHGYLHLVWQENGKIYYSQIHPWNGVVLPTNYHINKESVSEATAWTTHKYPSISLTDNYYPNVMWQA